MFMTFLHDFIISKSLVVVNALARLFMSCFVPKIGAVLLLICEVVEKRWFWSPQFVGDGIRQISDMHFQIALTSEHVAGFG